MTAAARTKDPLYARVTRDLIREIGSGRYPAGSMLPTEAALCERFGVSRITMRAALGELRERGMISRRAGVGTRVEASAPRDVFVHESDSIESILQFTDRMEFRLLEAHRIVAGAKAAAWLGCAEGERVQLLRGLRLDEAGRPIALSTHHIRAVDFDVASEARGLRGSLATYLESRTGSAIATIRQTIEATALGERDAGLLGAPAGEPALATWRWHLDEAGALLLASNSLFPRGRYIWSQTVRRRLSSA